MNILLVTKRHYTRRDLLKDRFGRHYHLPLKLAAAGHRVKVTALDYRTFATGCIRESNLDMESVPVKYGGILFPHSELIRKVGGSFRPDVVIGSGHLHIGQKACQLANSLGVPFVFEAYDYYPAFLPGMLKPAGRFWFDRLSRKASGCVGASQRLTRLMERSNRSCTVIENGFDPEVFHPVDRGTAIHCLGLDPEKAYVCFVGSATRSLGFGDLLAAMEEVRKTRPETELLHAGYLDPEYSPGHGFNSFGFCGQERVNLILNASSCGVVPYQETLQVLYSNSCKLVEYLSTNLPVVVTRSGDNARILGEDAPSLVDTSEPQVLARAIAQQLKTPWHAPLPDARTWNALGLKLERFLTTVLYESGGKSS